MRDYVRYLLEEDGLNVPYTKFPHLGSASNLDPEYFRQVMRYGYSPWGLTPRKNMVICSPYTEDEIYSFIRANLYPEDVMDLPLARNAIVSAIPPSDEIDIWISSGPDSAYLLALLTSLDPRPSIHVKTFEVVDEGSGKDIYSEWEGATKLASHLGHDITTLQVTVEDILRDLNDIVKSIQIPYDRGSLIPTYYMTKHSAGKVVIFGDTGDLIFGPGMSSHYAWKRDKTYMGSPFSKFFQNLRFANVLLFDALSEVPFYYHHKAFALGEYFDANVTLPYQDPQVVRLSLATTFFHSWDSYKPTLMKLIQVEGVSLEHVAQEKRALKLDTSVILDELELEFPKLEELFTYRPHPVGPMETWRLVLIENWLHQAVDG